MSVVIRIETWRGGRPAASVHFVIPAHNKRRRSSGTAPYQAHLKSTRRYVESSSKPDFHGLHAFFPIRTSYSFVFHVTVVFFLAYKHVFSVKSKALSQLSIMLPTVKTKCLVHLPNVLKNYRVRTTKTFIFVAFQIPSALCMGHNSVSAVFL